MRLCNKMLIEAFEKSLGFFWRKMTGQKKNAWCFFTTCNVALVILTCNESSIIPSYIGFGLEKNEKNNSVKWQDMNIFLCFVGKWHLFQRLFAFFQVVASSLKAQITYNITMTIFVCTDLARLLIHSLSVLFIEFHFVQMYAKGA